MPLNEIDIKNNNQEARTYGTDFLFGSVINSTYTLQQVALYDYDIKSLTAKTGGANITATLTVNGTAIVGCSGVSLSSSLNTYTATGANTVASGDTLAIWFSSAATNVAGTIQNERS